ncbi:hypothetical protein [Pedobacter sp. L105]|uniref:hypothetical protein n=1 Tax=Pedobacter sp. L105 TaxID=1641871 RepID=UPI00131B04EE|nr:hypothetical protein [Pedobacter sp. L105]
MNDKQVILILASSFSKDLRKKYEAIVEATSGYCDVKILFHKKDLILPAKLKELDVEVFTDEILHQVGYVPIGNAIVPGSNHFPLLQFYLRNPDYAYYWCIEDDVNFNGNWKDFFGSFSSAQNYDFISSHLRTYTEHPVWHWWQTLETPGKTILKDQMMLSFNPIYRLSNDALSYLDQCMRTQGWKGHHEVFIPTLLKDAGYQIADFGTEGNPSIPRFSFCTLRSMRWKPVYFVTGSKKNHLYHPVKSKISVHDVLRYAKRAFQNNLNYFS